MPMDAELLHTFLTVAETGGIGAAARQLHRSQPAITERLQKLARQVGEPLYIPTGRGVRLTVAGEACLDTARRLREVTRDFGDMLQRRQRLQEGILRIAATNTLAGYFLPRYLVEFRQAHAGIDLHLKGGVIDWAEISVADWDLFFLEGELDLERLPAHYSVSPWMRDEILVVFPENHPLLERESLKLDDLLPYPMVWRESHSGIRRAVEQEFSRQGLNPRQSIEVTGVEAVGTAVSAGLGPGFITSAALQYRQDWRLVARCFPGTEGLLWTLYLASPKPEYQSLTIRRFLAFLGLPAHVETTVDHAWPASGEKGAGLRDGQVTPVAGDPAPGLPA